MEDTPFSDTLNTWHDDNPVEEKPVGQAPTLVLNSPLHGEGAATSADPHYADHMSDMAARHQPPAGGTVREFADHIDRERQAFKDWVRREIGLLAMNKSHDERVAENP